MPRRERWLPLVPLLLLPLLLLELLVAGCDGKKTEEPAAEEGAAPLEIDPAAAVELAAAELYFPDDTGHLSRETVQLPAGPTELRIRRLAEAVIAGPQDTTGVLHAPLPAATKVGGVLVLDGVAYLDLHAENQGPPPAVGSMDEQMILYSLVDTVVLNTPGVDRMVVLWNGSQRETFAGHFDTTRPLAADKGLIANR
jgi:hypothetical protein